MVIFVLLVSRAVGSGLRNAEARSINRLRPDFLTKSVTPLDPPDALCLVQQSNVVEQFLNGGIRTLTSTGFGITLKTDMVFSQTPA